MRLCHGAPYQPDEPPGELSFAESISILDREPTSLGLGRAVVFYNDSDRFDYRKPDDLADVRSGVICSPNNFAYDEPLAEGAVRVTVLADYDRWAALDETAYRNEKDRWYQRMLAAAVGHVPDFRDDIIDRDMFTPTTIRRFTGHDRGAVYGAPKKHYDGTTDLTNLFICGTDQGLLGIVGSILSGITVANRWLLEETRVES
jgi:phytoene dehydrogenase-like protein